MKRYCNQGSNTIIYRMTHECCSHNLVFVSMRALFAVL